MTQTKQNIDTTTIDERIFHLFNSFQHNENSFEGSFAFATATPTTTLQLFNILKNQVSWREFNLHQSTYVHGMTVAINKHKWSQEKAQDLVDIANWFIAKCEKRLSSKSKRKDKTPFLSSPRKAQIQRLVGVVQSKVDVPQEQKDAWNALFASPQLSVPKDFGLLPETRYQTSFVDFGRSHTHENFDR